MKVARISNGGFVLQSPLGAPLGRIRTCISFDYFHCFYYSGFVSVQSGFNLPPKPAGAWTCSDCYASNSVEHSKCPCCECPNPNIPKQESKPGMR